MCAYTQSLSLRTSCGLALRAAEESASRALISTHSLSLDSVEMRLFRLREALLALEALELLRALFVAMMLMMPDSSLGAN